MIQLKNTLKLKKQKSLTAITNKLKYSQKYKIGSLGKFQDM